MKFEFRYLIVFIGFLSASCRTPQDYESGKESQGYVRVLERIERAGNRYRRAMDLVKYSDSSLERSLAESHLQLSRQFLESEFQLAEVESKVLALTEAGTDQTPATSAAEQSQYEKVVAEVWKLSTELDEAKQRLAQARQNLKKATTAEAFRKAQQAVDQAQQTVGIRDKKLDLAGSNLEIQDYKRKRGPAASIEQMPLADRLRMMREELFPSATKAASTSGAPSRAADVPAPPVDGEIRGGGILAGVRDYFTRREKFQALRRAQQETQQLTSQLKEDLQQQSRQLEALQSQHSDLNRKTESAYSRAYELLQRGSDREAVTPILEEADRQMATSAHLDQQKELANRGITVVKGQAVLLQEDAEKLANWTGEALEERNDSLFRIGSRIGVILALITLILLISHYLKKLPYRFTREGKNLYYFRKLISFASGLIIGLIVLLNFIGDFGGLSAVIGLAGAGLAIALQDPIVSLVGWFLIIGKFGISVGDRVEINSVKGDVIDIGLLRIAVLEVGNWVSAEQATGRVVFFPNSFIFKNHYFNYSTGNSFIWDEIRITVTYESDWKKARQIIEGVALRITQPFVEEAKVHQERVARRFLINMGTLTPYVYVSIAESGVDLVLRYLTAIRKRRLTHDEICREILEAFNRESDLDLAYPTRRSLTESRVVPAIPDSGSR
jgi:small-conductance mechanosensitive channel/predicted  nucleic acid-binding Zn-ribbon protein